MRDCGRATSNGFTLLEVVFALVIVVILALVAVPSWTWAMQKSRRTEGKILLYAVSAAEERYFMTTNAYTTDTTANGIGSPTASSPGGYYRVMGIQIEEDGQFFRASVEPQGSQLSDPCGVLSLDSRGVNGALKDGCW